jgi:hypothetical protein
MARKVVRTTGWSLVAILVIVAANSEHPWLGVVIVLVGAAIQDLLRKRQRQGEQAQPTATPPQRIDK